MPPVIHSARTVTQQCLGFTQRGIRACRYVDARGQCQVYIVCVFARTCVHTCMPCYVCTQRNWFSPSHMGSGDGISCQAWGQVPPSAQSPTVSLNPELTSKPRSPLYLPPCAGITGHSAGCDFYMCVGHLSSGPHACTPNTLPIESPLQPQVSFSCVLT